MQDTYEKMMEFYHELKEQVKKRDKRLYEQWKAGGFLVDNDIISMYPNLGQVVEDIEPDGECPACGEMLEDDICQNPDCE